MKHGRVMLAALMGASVILGGCASGGAGNRDTAAAPDDAEVRQNRSGVSFEGGGFIVSGPALQDGPGTIVAALTGKVPNFRLQRNSGNCPIITLRNAVSFQGVVNPHVYVDGIRATDTCVLISLRTSDVERVEVYPQGFPHRPGYGRHAHGLILVFMKSAGV